MCLDMKRYLPKKYFVTGFKKMKKNDTQYKGAYIGIPYEIGIKYIAEKPEYIPWDLKYDASRRHDDEAGFYIFQDIENARNYMTSERIDGEEVVVKVEGLAFAAGLVDERKRCYLCESMKIIEEV